jgi:hypothetical protein
MSASTLRTVIAVFLFVHAIGHAQGVIAAAGLLNSKRWNAHSWLFDNLLGQRASRKLAMVLFTVCILGFLATAFSFVGVGLPHEWWRSLAVIFAMPSLAGLVFYWTAFAQLFNKAGALLVNGWILVGMLALGWPSEAEIGF